ncbi:hypothetical protein KW805_00540 [Candidatus Pacearchaeota archaeon]|nr:hypothetical protein [Candidatus Pacearchaeota archaeon]
MEEKALYTPAQVGKIADYIADVRVISHLFYFPSDRQGPRSEDVVGARSVLKYLKRYHRHVPNNVKNIRSLHQEMRGLEKECRSIIRKHPTA